MKIACIAINSNLINCEVQNKIVDFLSKKLYEIGKKFSLISYFDNNLEKIKSIYNEKYNIIFVIGTKESIYNYNIKENIARCIGAKLETNQNAYVLTKRYCGYHNIPFSIEEENKVVMPENAIPLIMDNNCNIGFMYDKNDCFSVYLPQDLNLTINVFEKFISPMLNNLLKIKNNIQVVKCFGILEKDIRSLLADALVNESVDINIISDDIDNAIYIRYDESLVGTKIQTILSDIISKLSKYIYALEDISIYQMVCELLELQHKNICLGETITFGEIAKNLAEINPNVLAENYFFSKFVDIVSTFDLSPQIVSDYGEYSVNTIYEISNNILEKYNCDISVFTLGNKKSDICFIAIGDIDGIHVYKNKVNDTTDNLYKILGKTAMFYLIKKLKQNDLQFR